MLCELFQTLFEEKFNTCLQGGVSEPLYQPALDAKSSHCIYFSHDYFASALHEVAHWCIAGPVRRKQVDYGYWYTPDGRNTEQQLAFEQVEVKPQALEWMFCVAAGFRFRVSADNLNGIAETSSAFKRAIWQQTQAYCREGLPERGMQYALGLQRIFNGNMFIDPEAYRLDMLS